MASEKTQMEKARREWIGPVTALAFIAEWTAYHRGRDDTRLAAAWYGEGRRIKQRALALATEYAKAA